MELVFCLYANGYSELVCFVVGEQNNVTKANGLHEFSTIQ